MRTLVVALAIVLLPLAAHAQGPGGKKHHGSEQKSVERKPRVDDKAYGKALSTLPDKKYDPWKDIR